MLQDQDGAHKLWLSAHKVLLILHMASSTMLHKVAPSMFGGPRMLGLVMGAAPYRDFVSTWYRDGIWFAGFVMAALAFAMHMR